MTLWKLLEIISIVPELNLEFDLIAVIVHFFKAGKLFFRHDDVIMTSQSVAQVSKLGVLQL